MPRTLRRLVLFLIFILLIIFPTTLFLRRTAQDHETVNYWSKNPHNIHSHPFSDIASSSYSTTAQPHAKSMLHWPRLHNRDNATNSTTDGSTLSNSTYSNSTEPIDPGPTDNSSMDSIDCRGDYSNMSFLLRLICDGGIRHYALLLTYIAIGAVSLGVFALFTLYSLTYLRQSILSACEQEEMERIKRKKRMITGGGPLEELLIGIEELEGLENTDGFMVALPGIEQKRSKRSLHPRWVQGELNGPEKNVRAREVLEDAPTTISGTRGISISEGSSGSLAIRNSFMPSVSQLVIQASPRVVSTGHNIKRGGGRNSKMNRNPWRIAGWDFAA